MGLMGSLEWVNNYGKKRCKSLFCCVRAKVRKALKQKMKKKKQFRFQYDPSSYALNFDDGCCFRSNLGDYDGAKKMFTDSRVQEFDINNTTWVYVVWVKIK